ARCCHEGGSIVAAAAPVPALRCLGATGAAALRADCREAPPPGLLVAGPLDGGPGPVLVERPLPARLLSPRLGPQPALGLWPQGHPQRHPAARHPRRGRSRAAPPLVPGPLPPIAARQGARRLCIPRGLLPRGPGRGG